MSINFDVAALVNAILWPLVILIILFLYRKRIPSLFEWFASRVTRIGFAGFSLELAAAKPFIPEWTRGKFDLRRRATSVQVDDSTAKTFLDQLQEDSNADCAEVDLGTGKEWLTSRLFILAIVLARMKGIQHFVFMETSINGRKQYVGYAEAEKIRWDFSRRYPWFEEAYAAAYSTVLDEYQARIVSNQGRLGRKDWESDPTVSIELVKEFLARVQMEQRSELEDSTNWIDIEKDQNEDYGFVPRQRTYEHADELDSQLVEDILKSDLMRFTISSVELRSKNTKEQLKTLLPFRDRFIAVTSEDGRFEYLVDRAIILEQVARELSSTL